jgi:hypothetical protein
MPVPWWLRRSLDLTPVASVPTSPVECRFPVGPVISLFDSPEGWV